MIKISAISFLFIFLSLNLSYTQEWEYFDISNSGIPGNTILSLDVDKSNNIWVATRDGGLAMYDHSSWTVYNTSNSQIPSNNVRQVHVSDAGVWMNCNMESLNKHYLVRFYNNQWTIWKNIRNGKETRFSEFDIDPEGILWIPSIPSGGWIIKFDGSEFTSYNSTNSCLPYNTDSTNNPSSIFAINENQRWVGHFRSSMGPTLPSGVLFMDHDGCEIFFPEDSSFPDGHQNISEIHKDPYNDDIWVLAQRGILKYSNGQWETHETFSGLTTMVLDDRNGIWAAVAFQGVRYLENGNWINFNELPDYFVNHLVIDNKDGLWAATDAKGLAYFDLEAFHGTSSVIEQNNLTINVFPTVFYDQITIENKNGNHREMQFQLYNLSGELLIESDVNQISNNIDLTMIKGSAFIYTISKDNLVMKTGKLFSIE